MKAVEKSARQYHIECLIGCYQEFYKGDQIGAGITQDNLREEAGLGLKRKRWVAWIDSGEAVLSRGGSCHHYQRQL